MLVLQGVPFDTMIRQLRRKFVDAPAVDVGQWQSLDVSDKPEMVTHELQGVSLEIPIPWDMESTQFMVEPNLPWAEDHFRERVSGVPLNPPPSHEWWPFNQRGNAEHLKEEKFSHTYPERFWPKFANEGTKRPNGRQVWVPHNGIRYEYGDLSDVIDQLKKSPLTRQAYLPVWFPEDTGAVHGERVPCTLGYLFMVRKQRLHITYYIRSCDFLRHFRDDVYMAMRLCQWMVEETGLEIRPGQLKMHIESFHVFAGDLPRLRREVESTK
jgi:hypothetical protein